MIENEQLENKNVSRGTSNMPESARNGFINDESKLQIRLHISEKIISIKTRRRLNRHLKVNGVMPVNERNLSFLSVLETWQLINGRDNAGIPEVVNWGGYSANWRFECNKAIRACLELGLLRQWKIRSNAVRIGFTDEGIKVLWLYNKFYDVVLGEFQTSHEKAMLKESKRIYRKPVMRDRWTIKGE